MASRYEQTDRCDLMVIGCGIESASSVCDASDHGFRMSVVGSGDLVNHTYSAGTTLSHGGRRYPKHYEFSTARNVHSSSVVNADDSRVAGLPDAGQEKKRAIA